ncbi:unnamed protein product [Arabidopsis halleri]
MSLPPPSLSSPVSLYRLLPISLSSPSPFIILFDYSILENEDVIVVHEALNFGGYHFSIAIGIVDVVLDLLSSRALLKEDNLIDIEGGSLRICW